MSEAGWVALISFLALHLGTAIWFAASVNTQVKTLAEGLKALSGQVKSLVEADVRVAVLDARVLSIEQWRRDQRGIGRMSD